MNIEQAKKIVLNSEAEYICFDGEVVCLDGHFTKEDLEAIIIVLSEKKKNIK